MVSTRANAVDTVLAAQLRELLRRLYGRHRARGESAAEARDSAARQAAEMLACDLGAAQQIMVAVAAALRRPTRERLAGCVVDEVTAARLRPHLETAVYRYCRLGATPGDARAGAVAAVAIEHGCAELVAWAVLLGGRGVVGVP